MKKIRIIVAVLLVSLIVTGCQKEIPKLKDGNEAVATIGEKKISTQTLYKKLKDIYGTEKLIDIIDSQILEKKYSKKVEDAEKDADNNIKQIKGYYTDSNGNFNEDQLLAAIKQYYGYDSLDEFRETLKLNYFRNLETKAYAKSQITEKQMKKYYETDIVGDRKVAHIQVIPKVKDSMTDEEKQKAEDKALQKAKDAISELKKGKKFADVAKSVSADDSTKDKGGDLGYINKGSYGSDAFDKEVWSLEIGKYSTTPVKTETGYEIVYVTKEKAKKPFEKVKNKILKTLSEELIASDANVQVSALEKMRKDAKVVFVDKDLQSSYKKYMNDLHTAAVNQNNQQASE